MTQRDRWKKRPCVLRYRAFRDEVRRLRVVLPDRCHVTFVLPMPKHWRPSLRAANNRTAHRGKPDLDNLLKALLDAVFDDDAHVWDCRASKVWGEVGEIRIEALAAIEEALA